MREHLAETTQSSAVQAIREELDCATRSDTEVLITGENGSGKETLARLIHEGSSRQLCPFVRVDCAASPGSDLEQTLFGDSATQSLLESAHRGTMFLRNVAEMSPATQERLLKFLDDGEVASARDGLAKVDVRIMTAVDMNLHSEVIAGRFSEPLYYRLNTIHIVVPPLRQQAEDSIECLESSRLC